MYEHKIYEKLIVAIFTDEITLEDVEIFSGDIENITHGSNDYFLIALPVAVTKYPSNIADLLKAASHLREASGTVVRFYTTELSPVMTFMSKIITQIIGIKTKTITARDYDSLFEIIRHDTQAFPNLVSSVEHLDAIREYISNFEKA